MTKVIVNTNLGNIEFELLSDIAQETVRNFIKLAKSGFYDGTLFHRVIPKFMIQGGDPNTKKSDKSTWGIGGPGYSIKASLVLDHIFVELYQWLVRLILIVQARSFSL